MQGSTKILTVSYGTFSCTLEGFDDPLGTMRDIAEYFRDLAADDRYFGAEPPTPDVEMLQRIAQKEVQRRVEARVSDTGVALHQVATEAEVVAEKPAPAPAPEPAPAAEAPAEDRGALTFDDEFLMSDEPEDVLAVDPGARPPVDGPAESVAEKLRRIRAVVSRNIELKAADPSFSATQAPDAGQQSPAGRDRALSETIRQIQASLLDDEEAPVAAAPSAVAEEPEDAAPATAPAATMPDDEGPRRADASEGTDAATEAAEAPVEADIRDHVAPAMADDIAPAAEPLIEAAPAELPGDEESTRADNVFTEVRMAVETAPGNRAEDDDGWDFGDNPAETASMPEDAVADEVSARRRVTELLSSQAPAAEEDENDVLELDRSKAVPASRTPTRQLEPAPEGDVGRLLAKTDSKLREDEYVRRRRVISQMRAAVAATKADRMVSRQVSKEVEEEAERSPYREDLSQAVRVRPSLPGETQRRLSGVPPLVLVSSQRVDAPRPEQLSPHARPRLVEGEDFAQFAQAMGAFALPDLLEAAAAYTVFNEGQSSFTRPEIMKRVARVDPSIRLSREESLRTFGQLLRQGKFRKLERGQFTIDKDTRFHPGQRFAGE